jgi:hypothetical protein
MAGAYSRGVLNILNGTIDLDTTALKLMLVDAGYTYNPDHSVVDPGTNDAADLSFNEITATNYTAGFGGGGRKSVTATLTEQTANNRVVTIWADQTWTALGGAANDTVQAGVVVREITNDASSPPVVFFDFSGGNVTTNGSDFTIDFNATDGNLRWSV